VVTFAELRQARPESYRRAAQAWATLVEIIAEQGGVVASRGTALGDGWGGAAADAATAHLGRLGGELGDGAARAGQIPGILNEHAAQVEAAKATLQHVVAVTAATPIRVGPSGTVGLSPLAYAVPALVPRWQGLAAQVQAVIDGAVQRATAADATTTSRLNAALPAEPVTPTGPAAVPLDQVPRRGADPRAVNQWWRGLSPEQREWLLAEHPELVGNLDGVPAQDRDRANRTVLASTKAQLEQRRNQLDAKGDNRCDAEDAELSDINDKLKGINAIDRRLGDTGAGKQHAYLLGFDTDGKGHAIVAMGNPDTANNVVTYVPGTGTRLGSIGGDLGKADIMVDAARAADPSESTAAIVWVGYDAPQDIINTDLGHLGDDATSDQYAKAARDDLDRFQDGLRGTHDGPPSHNTVLGHSYGSTVVGYTARDRGLDADEVIFVGSPGVGVERAGDLGVPPEHVWSSTARNDPIQYGYDAGDLARVGVGLDGLDGLDPKVDLVHGANPSSADFGGQVFASDPGDPMVRWTWERHGPFGGVPVPVPHFSANAHSQYWDPGSASLENMGQIIVGNRPTRR
jgi:Alpha/beta hydrolase